MQTKELKIMILGPRCGKSTFINNITNSNNNLLNSNTTLGVDVTILDLYTNNGKRRLNFGKLVQNLKVFK